MKKTAEDWRRVRAAFERALELDEPARGPYLENALDTEALRREARALLRADAVRDDFLVPPPAPEPRARVGTSIGPFRIVRWIASGGMAAVYEAEQASPRRRVALKVLPPTASEAMLRRFRAEADLLARLRHPGIAQVFEAGAEPLEQAGERFEVPWFAMELVPGARSVIRYALEEGLDLEARTRLFARVCNAVHHGHRHGVLHRDLKPANLLVDEDGNPKVIDFGVAKALDGDAERAERTRHGELLGTLRYMSPEQLAAREDGVDVRTDVYALGIVLHELVCDGEAAFAVDGLSLAEACRRLESEDPPPPSRRRAELPREIDWIVAKATAKERGARYASAAELAEELARLWRHEPVRAGPPGALYQLRKLVRRHRKAVAAGLVVLVAALVALVGTTWGLVRARRAEASARADRGRAVEQAAKSEAMVDFLVDVLAAPHPGSRGREVRVAEALLAASEAYRERFADDPLLQARLAAALGEVYHGLGMTDEAVREHEQAIQVVSRERGPLDPEVGRLYGDLGSVQLVAGRLQEAERSFERSLAAAEASAGPDGAAAHEARAGIGRVRLAQRRTPEALALLRPATDGLARTLGPGSERTLLAQNALAGVLHEAGRLNEAEALYRTALEGLLERVGPDHPEVLRLRFNLGMLAHSRGRADEAIALFRELLEARRRTLGESHPDTLAVVGNLIAMLTLAERQDEAWELADASVEAMRRALPEEHPVLLATSVTLGTLESRRGNAARAEELWRGVHAVRERTLGPASPATLTPLYELARLARVTGRLEEAEALATRGFELSYGVLPAHDPHAFEFLRELGWTLLEAERYDEAEALLLESLPLFEALPGGSQGGGPQAQLALLYERTGDEGEAARWRAR